MKSGLKKAIILANRVQNNVVAYRNFVRKYKKINNEGDFLKLPIADKKTYIHPYSLLEILGNKIPKNAYASSGSSGNPTFWFRNETQDIAGGEIHEKIFKEIFKIKKQEPTLVIICFSMGVWIAGVYTLACCEWMSKQGYQMTTITPGIEKHDILKILKILAPNFKNVILAGYPSFIMDALVETKIKKIPLPKNLYAITAGDSFTEGWRNSAIKLLGQPGKFSSIISIYGSADAGIIGFESPLSIFIRRYAEGDKTFRSDLFGNAQKTPALVQFDPEYCYVESLKGELVLTTDSAIPLVRYNIHDTGRVVSYNDMKLLLKKYNLEPKAKHYGLLDWKMPFVIKEGRSDVAVTFYALNIYPEHIEAGLSDKNVNNLVSGNFRAYNKTVKNHSQENLYLEIELSEKRQPTKSALKKISGALVENLLKLNIEFRKLHASIGKRAIPKIKLIKKLGDSKLSNSKVLLSLKGKKPKMVV